MRGIRPIELVRDSLERLSFPPLARPRVAPKGAATEELVQWGTKLYVYSVIAHIRKILAGLAQLAHTENVPAANIVSRHIFEWAAQMCRMNRKLKDCYQRKDWEKAWSILTPAAVGNLWAKEHGAKYAPPSAPPLPVVPDPPRIGKAITEYEEYQSQTHGWREAKDTYGLLSEFSHPNAACLQQYQTIGNDGSMAIGYLDDSGGASSPLPFVNLCLVDFMLFVDELLQLARDAAVQLSIRRVLGDLLELKKGP